MTGDAVNTAQRLESSAKPGEAERYLDLLDARQIVDAWTTGGDVDRILAVQGEQDMARPVMQRVAGRPKAYSGRGLK